jgi:membrane associated rhomboid family serine protease
VLSVWFGVQHGVAPLLGVAPHTAEWYRLFGVTAETSDLGYPLAIAALSHFNPTHFILNLAQLLVLTSYLETRFDSRLVAWLLVIGGFGPVIILVGIEALTGGTRVIMGASGAAYTLFAFVCFHIAILDVPFESKRRRVVRQSARFLPVVVFSISIAFVFIPLNNRVAHIAHAAALVIGSAGWLVYTRTQQDDPDIPLL